MDHGDDERAIEYLLKAYCRSMDRRDDELGRLVFFDDSTVDYGAMFQGSGHGFVAFSNRAHERFETHLHRISNTLVELSGDHAASETYVDAQFRLREDGALFDLYTRGRYLDRWERREGRWAITHRRYVNEMAGKRPITEVPFAVEGVRDQSDPSYALFAALAAG